MRDRVLAFTGIHNFRDYGGYRVAGGGRLREGVLFRSAQHRDATPEDLTKVAALGLATVIDLRGPREREQAPCPRPDNFAARVLFVDEETASLAPHLEAARAVSTPEEARQRMREGYGYMPFRPNLVAVFRRYFDALADSDGPSLIHCMAGKDRTGIAVALFHAMAGVHHDDIMADYLLTNSAGNVDARIDAGARHVRAGFGRTLPEDAVRALMSVDPSYLDSAFAAIEASHGGVDAYLAEVIGLPPARRETILAQLVEGSTR
jgi:protein-tyrosine phosphatase